VLPILSEYLNCVSACVAGHQGTIDKFIGDAVMAFWGAPAHNPAHAIDSCRCAVAIQGAIANLGLTDDTGKPLRVRIGVNSGPMLVGNVGSEVRLNYTVIGDAVNIASRLESANKTCGTTILIGEETHRLAGDALAVRALDDIIVPGRAGKLRVFELLNAESAETVANHHAV